MDKIVKIQDGFFWAGVNDHLTSLFESVWPIPLGINYNAYVLTGGTNVVFDTVKDCFFPEFIRNIRLAVGEGGKVDYLVLHHLEPDHSGSLKTLLDLYPDMKIIGNKRTAEFLQHLYGGLDSIEIVEDGQTLSLGDHKLTFYLTPMVHWPETMMTWIEERNLLLSGDAFGSFGAIDGAIFDDQINLGEYEPEIVRYYSNIVAKYSPMVQRALQKLSGLDVKLIAPLHGPVWRKDVGYIVSLYDRLSKQEGKPGVVIAYGSMYGNTEGMMEAVHRGIVKTGVDQVRVHNVSLTHVSYVLRDIWNYKGLALAAPTYDTRLFPPMDYLVRLLMGKMVKNKKVGLFGTFGWSGGGVSSLAEMMEQCKLELVHEPVESRFTPVDNDLDECYQIGITLGKAVQE